MAAAIGMSHLLNVHALLARSAANGPGVRSVIWTQGCSIGCPGCFNPRTHDAGGEARSVDALIAWALGNGVEGVTITGGEPLDQAGAVLELARGCRREGLSAILLTGYAWRSLRRRQPRLAAALGDCVDVVLAGPYSRARHLGAGLRGSANKTVELLSDRYSAEQIAATPAAEVAIAPDGSLVLTGVDPVRMERAA